MQRLSVAAPQWAECIRVRTGIHGDSIPPKQLFEVWKWKQYKEIVEDITSQPFDYLQKQSHELEQEYREQTELVASYRAWLHLLQRTEQDGALQQNLMGWVQLTRKIGKGTGKRAPQLRAEARKLMSKCQDAVPAWVMTIGTALNNLVPGENQFDVVIIDEASQADLSALTMLYLAKKVIIVGDDKQVSPLAVGVDLDNVTKMIQSHLQGIPNAATYDGTTSLYDIGSQICRPLMLKEHFRCIPDIIGFSNIYCYEGKIKPLRDTSDCNLMPSLVSYRVDGERDKTRKINRVEAETTVALIRAMIDSQEYAHKRRYDIP